ncbi:MAG: sporulation protein YqfC [Syntrophomonadaceae bacterium]|jgi:sporulation protein YqfC|nr:sporulation protein YqfC [Syntrophomonadaceae bacterium]
MEKNRDTFNRVMADFLEIPRDLVMDIPKLTLIGRNELYIENHRGIIEFRIDLLRINLSRGFIEIQGSNLEIKTLLPEELFLIGEINTIVFRD